MDFGIPLKTISIGQLSAIKHLIYPFILLANILGKTFRKHKILVYDIIS